MSLATIKTEIHRYLTDPKPEVLCIKGKWGVGKTYGWRTFLKETQKDKALALTRYAYVSLFGLNSLDELRYALFENTVSGDNIGNSPNAATFSALIRDRGFIRRFKPIIDAASAVINRKGLADILTKSAFLAVRDQIICLDDLERAGLGIRAREVLGLASLLKEERNCKVVLLLNDDEYDEKEEFERHLEKVADITLRFDPTPQEAADIALSDCTATATLVKPLIIELGITNIRVIKRIERLTNQLVNHLKDFDPAITSEAVATLVLASWAVQQPTRAPTLDFLRTYNSIAVSMRSSRESVDSDSQRYCAMLANYPFQSASDLDRVIIDGAEAGYFVKAAIEENAQKQQEEYQRNSRETDFICAWKDLYHGSLATDDTEFLDTIYASAIKDAATISPLNINTAIQLLREAGRARQVTELIKAYITAHNSERLEFFDIAKNNFTVQDKIDDELRSAFAEHRAAYIDPRAPLDVLREIGARRSWDDQDVALMEKQSADDYERLFEALRGDEVRRSIEIIRVIGNDTRDKGYAIKNATDEALRRIAAKSPLRARKIQNMGIVLPPPNADGEAG